MKRALVVTLVIVFVILGLPAAAGLRPVAPAFPLVDRPADVRLDAAGNGVAVFSDYLDQGWARRFDRLGHKRGEDILIRRFHQCVRFSVGLAAVAPQGHFAVTWTCEYGPLPGDRTSGGQIFNADGVRVYNGSCAAIAADGAGNFVLAWESWQSWPEITIYAEVRSPSGAVRVLAFRVNDSDAGRSLYGVLADGAGRFIVLWHEGWPGVLNGQRFDAAGVPLGAQFVVPRPDVVRSGSFAMGPSGELLLVWTEPGPDGAAALMAQRYVPDWTSLAKPFPVALPPVGS